MSDMVELPLAESWLSPSSMADHINAPKRYPGRASVYVYTTIYFILSYFIWFYLIIFYLILSYHILSYFILYFTLSYSNVNMVFMCV